MSRRGPRQTFTTESGSRKKSDTLKDVTFHLPKFKTEVSADCAFCSVKKCKWSEEETGGRGKIIFESEVLNDLTAEKKKMRGRVERRWKEI